MEENAAYFNARISAMKEKLFPMLTYEKMLLMELPEITRYISEGDYNEDITELSKSFKGIDLIEYALNLNLARTFQKLINISQGDIHRFTVQYMRRWDVENVKSILRGLQSGASSNEITETLIPVGAIKFTYLIELTKMNYDSAKADLIEKNIIPAGIDTLSELEYEMDKIYFQESLDIATDVGEKDLIRYLSLEVDLYNVKIIMRLKNAGADFNIIRKDLILLGKRITKEFLNRIKDLSYGETVNFLNKEFHDLRLDPNGPVTVSERQLEKYLIMFGERISHLNMFSTLTALGFILKKYREIANLRLIVRGKQLGIDSDSIEKMLVV